LGTAQSVLLTVNPRPFYGVTPRWLQRAGNWRSDRTWRLIPVAMPTANTTMASAMAAAFIWRLPRWIILGSPNASLLRSVAKSLPVSPPTCRHAIPPGRAPFRLSYARDVAHTKAADRRERPPA
jgi:hypothetical protein